MSNQHRSRRRPHVPCLMAAALGLSILAGVHGAAAQWRHPLSVAVGTHALTFPWYLDPVGDGLNPAFMVGTDRSLRDGEHWGITLGMNLGFFEHHWWMTGLSLEPEVRIARRLPAGLAADLGLGLGYMHYFWRRETLELDDGRYVQATNRGRPSVIVPLSLTLAYRGSARRPATVSPFASVRWGVQGLFLEEIPAATHLFLLGGVRIQRRRGAGAGGS